MFLYLQIIPALFKLLMKSSHKAKISYEKNTMNTKQPLDRNTTSKVEVNEVSTTTVNQVTTNEINPKEVEFIEATKNKGSTYEEGLKTGVALGIKIGVEAGFQHAINEVVKSIPGLVEQELANLPDIKRAVSDGLRSGSSKCGEVMVNRYKKISKDVRILN